MHIPVRERRRFRCPDLDIGQCLELARTRFRAGATAEAADIYEQLVESHPQHSIALLADLHDRYRAQTDRSRYGLYVSRFFDFGLGTGDRVLDIGSGHNPFPFATHLADLSLTDGQIGRAGVPFERVDGKPVYECSVESMPFEDQEFDFVYCSHVLEHARDPARACQELMRIARRGYIETPTPAKDIWMNSARVSNHRWGVSWIDGVLVFSEYLPEEVDGFGCGILMDMHCAPQTPREKAFSALIYLKANLVNTMVCWDGSFNYEVRLCASRSLAATYGSGIPAASVAVARDAGANPSAVQVESDVDQENEREFLACLGTVVCGASAPLALPAGSEAAAVQAMWDRLPPEGTLILRGDPADVRGDVSIDAWMIGLASANGPGIRITLVGRDLETFERLAAALQRLPRPLPLRAEPADRFQAAVSERPDWGFMQVHTFYPSYLQDFHNARPHLAAASFDEQIAALVADGFSAIHMFAPYMGGLGYRAWLIVANDPHAQARWLMENGQTLRAGDDWVREIVRRQIETIRPDVLYLSDPITFDGRFLQTLDHKPALVLGWRASMIPDGTDWRGFDLMLSSLESLRRTASRLGASGAEHFFPGYPEWINTHLADTQVRHDVVFSGQWSLGLHANRNRYLQTLAEAASDPHSPFSLGLYLSGQLDALTPEVAKYSLPGCYGVEMQRALRSGRIAIDARGILFTKDATSGRVLDLAGRQTANMRLFEATGCGVFLLAEHHDNLRDYFEPGVEIETFRDERELIEKVRYYLAHPEEREAIARRGQARCLAEYSMQRRAAEMDRLIRKHRAG